MKNKFNPKWFLKRKVYLNEHEFKLKEWLQIIIHDSLNWKAIIIKIIVFLINAAILIPISLHLQYWALRITPQEVIAASNSIIGVQPIGNPGIEFSLLSHTSSSLIFFIESITIILSCICLILVSPKIYLLVPVCFVLIGGIMNTNCRASVFNYYEGSYFHLQHLLDPTNRQYGLKNIVIDYWHFNSHTTNYVIFNFSDTCIISGSIGYITFLIISISLEHLPSIKKEWNKMKQNENIKDENIQ